jgi:hypothetical protein
VRARNRDGSVVLDKRINVWNFFWWENGKRRSKKIGTLADHPTKASAWRAAKALRHSLENHDVSVNGLTMNALVERYKHERMPTRRCTARTYSSWLNKAYCAEVGQHPRKRYATKAS